MNTKLTMALLVSGLLTAVSSQAEDYWYAGAQYSAQNVDLYGEDSFDTFGINGGYRINEYLALEGRFNYNITSNEQQVVLYSPLIMTRKEELDTQIAFLAKFSFLRYDDFNAYAIAGYTMSYVDVVEISLTEERIPGVSPYEGLPEREYKRSGFTYGLGVEYQLNEQFTLFADYQVLPEFHYANGEHNEWHSLNIGVNYRF